MHQLYIFFYIISFSTVCYLKMQSTHGIPVQYIAVK